MIRVKTDLGAYAHALGVIDQAAVDRALQGIAEAARAKWTRLAQAGLHTTRQAYLLGLGQPELEGPGRASVTLTGNLPNMIERGADAFDLREGLLGSANPNVRTTANGSRYRFVPLRMTSPGTRGAVGQPMDQVYAPPGPGSRSGRAGLEAAKQIGQMIYARAKGLAPGENLGATGLPKLQPGHASAPFDRLMRAGAKGHRYYVAFRTVSDRVDKWQHPGFNARNFVDGARAHAEKVGPAALKELVRNVLTPTATPTPPQGDP